MQPALKLFAGPRLASAAAVALITLVIVVVTGGVAAALPEQPQPLLPGTFAPSEPGTGKPDPSLLEGAVPGYAKRQGVSEDQAREALQQQALGAGLEEALRKELPADFGGLVFDEENGRWKVFLTRTADEAGARKVLADRAIRQVTIARVQWSTREREAAVRELALKLKPRLDAGTVAVSDTPRDGVVIKLDATAAADDVTAATEAAAAADDIASTTYAGPERRPEAAACLSPYCDPPLVAGVAYRTSNGITQKDCTTAFAAYVTGSGNRYNLTAGHCTQAPSPFTSCNANHTWCPQVGADIGGYYQPTGDGGIMQNTNGSFPNYPAFRVFGWTYPTYGVLGSETAAVGQYLCHTGRITYTTCGNVISTTAGNAMGGATSIAIDGACAMPGDSGGPLFDPSNGRAVGISVATFNGVSCPPAGTITIYEPVNNAMAVFGVHISTV
jgi:hypothetical protein